MFGIHSRTSLTKTYHKASNDIMEKHSILMCFVEQVINTVSDILHRKKKIKPDDNHRDKGNFTLKEVQVT